ncbi:MAG: aspartate aminotransferase family protein [Pseudonocardiales bacterium]|nr:aspartate aminotransferase family protein [Pseudonocardiales bacterium]
MSLTNDKSTGGTAVDDRSAHERDQRFVWHPWSPVQSPAEEGLMLVAGIGCHVRDADGREYLDAMASAMNSSCGYAHPALIAAAERQLSLLPHFDLSVGTHPPVGLVAERISALLPDGLDRTLFVNSGSEATEAAVRIVRGYWRNLGRPRDRIVTFAAGYHGTTLVAQHLSGLPTTATDADAPFQVTRVELPVPPARLRTREACAVLAESFERAVQDGPPPAWPGPTPQSRLRTTCTSRSPGTSLASSGLARTTSPVSYPGGTGSRRSGTGGCCCAPQSPSGAPTTGTSPPPRPRPGTAGWSTAARSSPRSPRPRRTSTAG